MSQGYARSIGTIGPASSQDGGVTGFDSTSGQILKNLYFNYWIEKAEGRLTLSSGTPAPTSTVSGSTIYYTPYVGENIAIYDTSNSVWKRMQFAEISVAVPSTTNTMFDIFAYDNSGTLALETLDWTNDTTRATAITRQDGVWVKSGDASRRYLGSGRTGSTSGQCEDTATQRFLWNYYNRIKKRCYKSDATSHTYATASWRYWNNDSSQIVELIQGISEDFIYVSVSAGMHTIAFVGFMNDASNNAIQYVQNNNSGTVRASVDAVVSLTEGYHFFAITEQGNSGSSTFENAHLYVSLLT